MLDDQVYSEPCHSKNSLLKHFQFRDTDAYSVTLTDAQLRGTGEASPALFEKFWKIHQIKFRK